MGRNPAPINQLSEPTKDSQPDENTRLNCEFASLAWIIRDIGSEPDADGDELHDECEGQGATGVYDGSNDGGKFFAAAARRGVQLAIYRGTPNQLIAKLHAVLDGGGDALLSIPSQWGTPVAQQPASFPTHMVAMGYTIPGGLRAMNPWGGFFQDGSDSYWAERVCYGYILTATAVAVAAPTPPKEAPVLQITDPTIAQFFALTATGSWKCRLNGIELFGAILEFYRANDGFRRAGAPLSEELHPLQGYGGVVRVFERGAIACDPDHKFDAVIGQDGACYWAHIDTGAVQGYLQQGLQAQLAQAQAAATKAAGDLEAATAQLAQAHQALADAQAKATSDEATLQQQLTAAQTAGQQAATVAQQATTTLAAAQAQVGQLQQELAQAQADGARGIAIVAALKAALA